MWEYEQALCPQCNSLRSVCESPETAWYPQQHVCWSSVVQAATTRRWQRKHEGAKPDAIGALPTDGRFVWMSTEDLTPDDDFV